MNSKANFLGDRGFTKGIAPHRLRNIAQKHPSPTSEAATVIQKHCSTTKLHDLRVRNNSHELIFHSTSYLEIC